MLDGSYATAGASRAVVLFKGSAGYGSESVLVVGRVRCVEEIDVMPVLDRDVFFFKAKDGEGGLVGFRGLGDGLMRKG